MKYKVLTKEEYIERPEKDIAYRGWIPVSYEKLVSVFGEPMGGSSDGKTQAEWAILFEDGTLSTIYDYKSSKPKENVSCWSIGGSFEEYLPESLYDDIECRRKDPELVKKYLYDLLIKVDRFVPKCRLRVMEVLFPNWICDSDTNKEK